MEAAKFIVGWILVGVLLVARWRFIGRDAKVFVLARRNGISQWRAVPPYDRWGISLRCDLWTIWGASFAGLLGFGVGWAYLGSAIVGALLALPAAAYGAWRCRTIMSIILVYGTPRQTLETPDGSPATRVRWNRLQWGLAGAFCGVFAGVTWAATFGERGTIVPVATVGAAVLLAWKFVQIGDRSKRRAAASAGSAPPGPRRS